MLGFHAIFPDVASRGAERSLRSTTTTYRDGHSCSWRCTAPRLRLSARDDQRAGCRPSQAGRDDQPRLRAAQAILEPLNPQSDYSPRLLEIFREMIETDPSN